MANKIADLSAENERLKQENERLSRLQLGSNVAAFAQVFDERVNDWVAGDYVITDLESGVSVNGMDAIINSAFRHAARVHAVEAFSEVSTDGKVEIIKQTLPENTVAELAIQGLTKALHEKPEVIAQFLNHDEIAAVLGILTEDEEQKELLLNKLTRSYIEIQDIESLQEELDTFGHFSTDKLAEGSRITIDFMYTSGLFSHCLTGRVVKTRDGQHWISVIEDSRSNSKNGRFVRGGIDPHTLLRFGHVDGEGRLVAVVVPGTETRPIYKDSYSTQSITPYIVHEFHVNDTPLHIS